MTATTEPTPVSFKAEVRQLLQILAHSLYTDREIFLRELISNASDALYRAQFALLTEPNGKDADAELEIRITTDEEAKTITISDTGIGMTRAELERNLGTIAHSGAREIAQKLEAAQRSGIIGQFGVGFYSAFVVADEVTVVSRSIAPDAEAAMWRADGGDTYEVGPAERDQRGTSITLKLKEDAHEFASPWRLRQIIKKHSDFVAFPIYIGEDRANQTQAIWRKAPREVQAEEYKDFYRQLTFDYTDPIAHLHLSSEAPVDIHAILFIPGTRERGMIERRVDGKIKLYSRKILIQEEAKELLPNHFRFIEGVVDSEDLPLNVARETVQSSQTLGKIKKRLTDRLLKELTELAEKDAEQYAKFWQEFGAFIKEGVATDAISRSDLLPLLRFYSSKDADALVSLQTYKERMIEGQSEIYYILASDIGSARRSPHLEALAERGIEALLLPEVIDGFMLQGLREFDGHKLRNADDPNLDLPGVGQATEAQVSDEAFARLVMSFKETLGERVTGVRASNLLRSSPARLVSPEDAQNKEMERVQRMLDREFKVPAKLLELNRAHPLVVSLARLTEERPADPLIPALTQQLYDSALLLEGLHPNPAEMVSRIETLMEAAAKGALS